jgi:DNA-directed RNA polymerase specialized sigma24 family protein
MATSLASRQSDEALWEGISRRHPDALAEARRRHREVALALARTITRNPDDAEQAVAAAFVRLPAAAGRTGRRSLRVEVLDATRRWAGSLVDQPAVDRPPVAVDAVSCALPNGARDVLALAIVAGCGCAEIAEIVGCDHATVHHHMRVGLRHARALLRSGPPVPAGDRSRSGHRRHEG